MDATPMFPLGTVLFPGMPLPLQIFELRYHRMLTDVLASDGILGVVLIERGREVGGGDVRCNTGTLARIVHHEPRSRGRHSILAVGLERIRITNWLPDDPYPRATTTGWPDENTRDEADPPTSTEAETSRLYRSCTDDLRDLLATATGMGHPVAPSTFTVPDDPTAGSYLLASLAPLGPFDKQRLLEATGPSDRLNMLSALIAEQRILLTGDLRWGN